MPLSLPVLDETGPTREATRSLLSTFRGVASTADEVAATWNGLGVAYSAPGAPVVLAAMARLGVCARTLAEHAETTCAALMVYANRLDELKTIREQPAAGIITHEAKAVAVSQCPIQGDDATAQQHQLNLLCSETVALEGRVARFVQALEDTQQECSSKIHAARGNTAYVGGGVVNLASGGLGLTPIESDLRVWEIDEARHGRLRSGKITQKTGANGEALELGESVAGESAATPCPEPWKYPGDSEGERSGPYAQRGANLGDYVTHEAAASAAGLMQPSWPDAARNLMHFLGNSGKPIDMNINGMLSDLPKLQSKVSSDIESYVDKAVKDAKNSRYAGPVTYPFVTEWQGNYARRSENENWFYATGGYQHATAGTITVYPDGSYTYKYQVHAADRYNWDGNKKTRVGLLTVTDKQLRELRRAG